MTSPPAQGAGQHAGQSPPGGSAEQRRAERIMLDLLSQRLGRSLQPEKISHKSGAMVEVDGTDADRTILVECWAHQGPPKAAQRHKILADAFKLAWISGSINPRPRLILCLSDHQAAAPFLPVARTWAAAALADHDIDVQLVELPADIRQVLIRAQLRQYR